MARKANRFKTENGEEKKESTPNRIRLAFRSIVHFIRSERTQKSSGVLLVVFSFYLLIAFTSFLFTWKPDYSKVVSSWVNLFFTTSPDQFAENWMGKLGAVTSHLLIYRWFGVSAFFFVPLLFLAGIRIWTGVSLLPLRKTMKYSFFLFAWTPAVLGFLFRSSSLLFLGGGMGYRMNLWLGGVLGDAGSGLLLLASGFLFAVNLFNIPLWRSAPATGEIQGEKGSEAETREKNDAPVLTFENVPAEIPLSVKEQETEPPAKEEEKENPELTINNLIPEKEDLHENPPGKEEPKEEIPVSESGVTVSIETPKEEPQAEEIVSGEEPAIPQGDYDPKLDLSSYELPTLDLLENYGSNKIQVNKEEVQANSDRIVETLGHYDIEIEKIKATIGPTVTLYEIVPKAGTRIQKIKNLEDDIALSLSALGIRIIAPMPGKGTIGIEVPNLKPEIVSMRSVLSSEKFQSTEFDLPIGLGKTIANEVFIADLSKMPHLLMAGATGQGKSVGLNAILASLLYKKHPSQVKFVMIDPKKVELTLFKTIERHFLAKLPGEEDPIITDTKKVIYTLNSLCIEMDNRFSLMQEAAVRNIKEYNAKFIARKLNPNKGHRYLPYIVLVIDEFADLIMTAGKEVETPITRLAQLARAIGIHLVIATQRPSVNIITGTIKANFPARVAFRVTAKVDSRTILDTGGADQLIGKGDMLLAMGADLIRLQCAFVDTPEVEKITSFIGSQRGYPDAFLLPEYHGEEDETKGDFDPSERDAFFGDAARIVVQHQQGSASLLQRKLKLGYNRAGRIVDQLEAAGIIGPFEGSKAREVRIKDLNTLEQLLRNLDNNQSGAEI